MKGKIKTQICFDLGTLVGIELTDELKEVRKEGERLERLDGREM